MDEYRESLIFGDEEKLKPINQTSSFKGKSCFKKEKEKDKSKFAVKINAPEPTKNEENVNEEPKYDEELTKDDVIIQYKILIYLEKLYLDT